MRGSPLLHVLLLLIGLVMTGAMVAHVTREREVLLPRQVTTSAETKDVAYDLVITSTVPATLEVTYAGKVLAGSEAPTADFSGKIQLPTEGSDLVVSAKWEPANVRGAVRVQVLADGDVLADKTFWGEGSVEDVCTVERSRP